MRNTGFIVEVDKRTKTFVLQEAIGFVSFKYEDEQDVLQYFTTNKMVLVHTIEFGGFYVEIEGVE
jgi:hypothetical protein